MRLGDKSCDVMVVGGGVAGVCAAIASSRLGADTILVEKNPFPGGSAVIAMHHHICGLYDLDGNSPTQPDHTLNKGLVREICRHLYQQSPKLLPEKIGRVHVLPFHTDRLKSTFHDLINNETLLEPHFDCRMTDVVTDNQRISSIHLTKGHQNCVIQPKAVVDCSGDAIIARLSGSDLVQDRPHMSQMDGFSIRIAGLKNPDEMVSIQVPYVLNQAVLKGMMPFHVRFTTVILIKERAEAILKFAIPNKDKKSKSASARKIAQEVHHYLTTQISAFEKTTIEAISSKVVPREGARMMGKYLLTAEDLLSGRCFKTKVVKNAWPIEFWHPEKGPQYQYPKGCYDIPEECLCSSNVRNLFSGGRCISVTSDALGSTRVMGTCMSLGEQAGRLAAEFACA